VKLKVGQGTLVYACDARTRGAPRGENGSNIEEKKMSRLREKTTATLLIAAFMISAMTFVVSAKPKNDYKTITEGEIFYSAGHLLGWTTHSNRIRSFWIQLSGTHVQRLLI